MRVTTRAQPWITPATILGMLLSLFGASFLIQEPPKALAQTEPGTQVNVELMMDSSGSMAAATDTGEPRIDAAKRVLNQVIDAIPADRPEINVGFRVFGHKGDNTEAGRAESCQSSELTVPVEGVDKDALRAAGRRLLARRVDADRAFARACGGRLPGCIGDGHQRDHPGHRRPRDLRCRPLRTSPPR